MSQKSDALRQRFLHTALPDAPFDGWTPALLERTAGKLKISDETLHTLFPRGVQDLIALMFSEATDKAAADLARAKNKEMRVRDRITFGVRRRLELLAPHKTAVASALSFMALPPQSFSMPKMVWSAADKIWWAAGDTATDYNHYTKRGLLSGVMSATMLFWLNDDSEDHAATWEFLDRRIENVMTIGKTLAQFKRSK